MLRPSNRLSAVLVVSALVVGGASLSGCATKKYVDEQITLVNTHIDAVDARAQDGIRRADAAAAAASAAASSAQAANAAAQGAARAAQAAAGDAQRANSRLDTVTTRVDTLEQQRTTTTTGRRPRN
jgi:outer membrane murein-binding lipoprotein Lpp